MEIMQAAFAKAGVDKTDNDLRIAIARFMNNGGTEVRAHALVRDAYVLARGGHDGGARGGLKGLASPRQLNADEGLGQGRDAARPNRNCPPSSATERGGEGHTGNADKATRPLPSPSLPNPKVVDVVRHVRRKPGHCRFGLADFALVQPTLARSLWDTIVLPDGRRLGRVRWKECPDLATKWGRAARLLMAVYNHATPADPNITLDGCVTTDRLSEIVAEVEKSNDIG